MRRVLIPVSTNIDHRRVLHALRLLQWKDAEYTLLNIIQLPQPSATYHEFILKTVENNKKIIEELGEYLRKYGFETRIKVAVSRDVVSGITEEVRYGGYSLVILFRKPRGFLGRIMLKLFKSVSQQVLDDVNVPVLIIPKE
ncbi:MAG: universal stress protein [Nitrososphaerota archaeon]